MKSFWMERESRRRVCDGKNELVTCLQWKERARRCLHRRETEKKFLPKRNRRREGGRNVFCWQERVKSRNERYLHQREREMESEKQRCLYRKEREGFLEVFCR